ncbi:MAG TPA: MmgE/PrpD family protein [Candidatus Tectomicrobia bacterium]|nr:MmgE/PrpD family protein [Candidatus Tectomicrobia bacterium]
MGVTEQLATFVVDTAFTRVPSQAYARAKEAILDGLGCALAGSPTSIGKLVTQYVRERSETPRAAIIGSGVKTSAPLAALANGTMAHALDFDDVNWSMSGHPTVPLLPAVLALGQEVHASGEEVLLAYALGFEVETKIGLGINPRHYDLGWHATSTLGVLGAAAACAKLLRLDVEHTRMALGIAASTAAGLRQNFGTMTKPLHPGHAAMNGVTAAQLAQLGWTADANILEAPYGFCQLYAGAGHYNLDHIVNGLGNPFELLATGVAVKQYPCCAFTHRALDGMLALVQQHRLSADEVVAIDCRVGRPTMEVLIHSRPQTGLEGKFSMQYCMASALLDKRIGLLSFSDEKVRRPAARQLFERLTMSLHAEAQRQGTGGEELPVTVAVRLKDGRTVSTQVQHPKGHPANPLSAAALQDKFEDCAFGVLERPDIRRVIDLVQGLEQVEDIGALMDVLMA